MPDRSRPFWSVTGSLTTSPSAIYLPSGWKQLKIDVSAPCFGKTASDYTPDAVTAVSGITTLTSAGGATGGDFSLAVFMADEIIAETTALTFDESAADVKTALIATNLFATGDITAAGGTLDATPITLTWTGVYAYTVPPIALMDNNLTGGSNASIQVRTTTAAAGNGGYGYIAAGTEVWSADSRGSAADRFLWLAGQSGAATYYVTAYQ